MWHWDVRLIIVILLQFMKKNSSSISTFYRLYSYLISNLLFWDGVCKRKLCVWLILIPSAPADSPLSTLESLGYLYCTFLSDPTAYVCVCMCMFVDSEWGLFRGFTAAPSGCVCQRRNLGMCSSNKREREERKRENGSASVFCGAQNCLHSMWGNFSTVDPEIPPLCVCVCVGVYAQTQLSPTGLFEYSEQWGVYWSD